jgi:hypothetical protein
MKPTTGGNTDSCNGTRHSVIEHFLHGIRSLQSVNDEQPEKVMQLFCQMWLGVSTNKFTFVQVINACAGLGTIEDGRAFS